MRRGGYTRVPMRGFLACIAWQAILVTVWAQPQPPAPSPAQAAEPECLKCHEPIRSRLTKKVVHAAVEMGCPSCHVEHRKESGSKSAHYLSAQPPELCFNCHDAKDEKLVKAHHGQPFEKAACTGCHDPHSSDAPKLILERAHGPFGGRQCEGCHAAPENGKVKLVSAANELCFGCHDEFKVRFDKAKVKHSLLASGGSCVDCHDPHAARVDRFLKKPAGELCTDCHAGVTADKKFVHEPVKASCVFCHDAHGSDFQRSLHARPHDVCLACHGPNGAKILASTEPVPLFGGRVTLPPRRFEDLKYLDLAPDGKTGHPMHGHPVEAPAAGGRAEMNCLSCHVAHGSEDSSQLLAASGGSLCFRCHQK